MDFFDKIPNWLRYILAIPFGILCLFIGYFIGYISTRWISDPDSWMMLTYNFLYSNGINVIVMMLGMNYMLPKYRLKFTIIITLILFFLEILALNINIFNNNITVGYILGLFLIFLSYIYSCYLAHKQDKEEIEEQKD